jgi:serine/threonine protein kinase
VQIDLHQLITEGELGRGAFGVVVAARYFGERVAVKKFQGDQSASLLAEAASLCHLRHKYIVCIRGTCTDPDACDANGKKVGLALVMQLAHRGSIVKVMEDPVAKRELRGRRKWLLFLSQAAHGIFYLHSQSIVHCDIKAGNLLVTEQLEPLVADFGLACHAGGVVASEGTPAYMAPELLAGETATCATDMYAFGLIMWFVCCSVEVLGQLSEPWDGELFEDIMEMVLAGKRPEWPEKLKSLSSLGRFREVYYLFVYGRCLTVPQLISPHLRPGNNLVYVVCLG